MKNKSTKIRIKHKKVPFKIYFFSLAFFVAISLIHSFNLYRTAREYNLKQQEVMEQLQIEQAINDQLLNDLEHVNNGSDIFIEREAREKLGLVMPNEILFFNVGH